MPQHLKAALLKLVLSLFFGALAALFISQSLLDGFHWRPFAFGLLLVGISLLFLNAFRAK